MTTTGVTMTSAALVVFYGTLCYAWGCAIGFSVGRRKTVCDCCQEPVSDR